ncbi:MAG: energy-coupling factor ABC transporter substrate-binding protein [Bacillota bacterium]
MDADILKQEHKKNGLAKTLVLIAIVIGLAVVPLFMVKNAEFSGADDQAEKAITEINANYKPWFSPVWEPPSGEIESLLFALQAALGAGFIGYYLGYARGRRAEKL